MSAPYSAPKRLERSRSDRFIGGVCGGIAKYLNMDPTLVRILTVVITLFTFVPVIAYIIAMFVMPEEAPAGTTDYPGVDATGSQPDYSTYPTNGRVNDSVWGSSGAPWDQSPSAQAPSAQAPSTQAPSTQAPSTQAPSTQPSTPEGQPTPR